MDVKEVLDTFLVAAELGSNSLGAYVISMASEVCFHYLCFASMLLKNLYVCSTPTMISVRDYLR